MCQLSSRTVASRAQARDGVGISLAVRLKSAAGYADLSSESLRTNEYNTVSLDLPPDIQSALQVPGRTCQIRLTVNTAPTATNASFYVDRVGFRD